MEPNDLEELIDTSMSLLNKARVHKCLSMCFNPGHTHAEDPCSDNCLDHTHQCSQGCGEWPCDPIQLGDAVASHLQDVVLVRSALEHSADLLQTSVEDLSDWFRDP